MSFTQRATTYDVTSNKALVQVTAVPSGQVAPWQYTVAVRGSVVTTGSSSASSVAVTLTNDCSITSVSVTVTIVDAAGRTAYAPGTLDRSLCPPPPKVAFGSDHVIAGPTLTEDSFVDRLRAVGSPALPQARSIYRTLVAAHVNPAFALGTFQAESGSGLRGYATTTLNWGNILYYTWQAAFGATPYAPGNGYTYARYPTWLASVQAYATLLTWYDAGGYITISSATAHWLGTVEGSSRHLTYLGNISRVMAILPTDAVPVMTSLTVPARSRAAVAVSWTATDDRAVTSYQVRARLGTGAWSSPVTMASPRTTLTLGSGTWTVGVRAGDADGNWSAWRVGTVAVDAGSPTMTALTAPAVVRSRDGTFSATWAGRDNVGVTRYQYRYRRTNSTTWSAVKSLTATKQSFALAAGSWYLDVRAVDAVGNTSAWREVRVVVPSDDRAFSFSAGVRRVGASDYRGTVTTMSRSGAHVTTTFTGTAFYLVGRNGPNYGRMRVTIDGRSYVVDAGMWGTRRATVTRYAVVLFSKSLPAGRHVVTITNLATARRPSVAIDGLGFVR